MAKYLDQAGLQYFWECIKEKMESGAATKVGTDTVGSGVKPIYLNEGAPTASTSTVGSATKPVYLSAGEVTVSAATVGSGVKPVYLKNGELTECEVELTNIYKYQGSVATEADLPATSTAGYVYNVEDTGMNYAWNGTAWDSLGIGFDVATITTADIDSVVA